VRVAAAPPAVAGVKITCTAQLAPASRVAPQVEFAVEKLAAAGPVIWNPGFARAAPPLLVTLMEAGAPATPTGCAGKVKLVALAESAGGKRPVPLRATDCFAFSASATASDPDWVPDCVGANESANEQLECAARVAVQFRETACRWAERRRFR